MKKQSYIALWVLCILLTAHVSRAGRPRIAGRMPATRARQILDTCGVRGGLVVHLGCGGGTLTAALRADDRYLVHGLDTGPGQVEEARAHIKSLGLYGTVSVDCLDGRRLPYADNLVNLVVAEDIGDVPMNEVMRVLCPDGVVYMKRGETWAKTIKPRPDTLDEWTHHLHDAGGNPVASDRAVGPPQHLQWTAGPLWARSHGWTPSVSAMVSAGGRLFCICDETLTCVDGTVPSKWNVVARDAFSGVLLWKCPIPQWGSVEFSGTPNSGQGVASVGRFTMPTHVGKRLVAIDNTVYVTLGPAAPVTALDAATGKVKHVYTDTVNADEILYSDGRLIVSINPSERPANTMIRKDQAPPVVPGKQVCAVNPGTGHMLWKQGPLTGIRVGQTQDPSGRLELAAGDGKVFLLTSGAIECLSATSGERLWKINRPALPETAVRRMGFSGMFEYLLTVMVYHDGVILLAQPEPNTHHTYHTMPGTLYAFDAEDGREMWKRSYGGWGHCTPPDVFVADDVVWTHVNAETEFGSVWGKGYKAKDSSIVDYRIQALELRTGKLIRELSTKEIFNVGHHHRCYRNKSTERFLMSCRRGVEFVDLSSGDNYQNHWVRSGCLLGYLPCNGLLYVTPHPCECYITAKITGFNALAPARQKTEDRGFKTEKLVRGHATATISDLKSQISNHNEWPTYRGDSRRSGTTESSVSTDLNEFWRSDIGARPSALVVAAGKVLVAGVDAHTVYAINADDGTNLWEYTTGARVDSPPTVYNGLAIFGSADGRVYCLRAADGELVWRFDAAPDHRLVTAFEQLESPWPVPGSVLVHDRQCWFAAGRASHLDGGIHVYALDPMTGEELFNKTIYSLDPDTGKMPAETEGHTMSGLLNDIPATDGANVFIRQMQIFSSGARGGRHLYTTGGYLDPTWFNRTFWKTGQTQSSGLMVLGKDVVYGMELFPSRSRETVFKPGSNPYRLRCLPLKPQDGLSAAKLRRQGPQPLWENRLGIRVTAMLRAADTIFVAGSPDIVDPDDPHGAWEGRKGGLLAAFSARDGQKLAERKLPAPPVWDSLATAYGRLYVSLVNGDVLCLANK